jgi:hypothetical protein
MSTPSNNAFGIGEILNFFDPERSCDILVCFEENTQKVCLLEIRVPGAPNPMVTIKVTDNGPEVVANLWPGFMSSDED